MYNVFFAFHPLTGVRPCIFVDFSLFNDQYVVSDIYKNVVFCYFNHKNVVKQEARQYVHHSDC